MSRLAVRNKAHEILRAVTGIDIKRVRIGLTPYEDARRILSSQTPMLFDVGANTGQTIDDMRHVFPESEIHSFEPHGRIFSQLSSAHGHKARVHLNNVGLGSKPGHLPFNEHPMSVFSSFLPINRQRWGDYSSTVEVPVTTLDSYCSDKRVASIDVLKLDTQGFEMEILKGANAMLPKTKLLYLEITLAKYYEESPRFDSVYGFLADRGFEVVSFYDFHYGDNRLDWFDALLINPKA